MTAPNFIRVVICRVSWPSLADRPNRSGLSLAWDAFIVGGLQILSSSENPYLEAAHLLVHNHGVNPNALYTMRHDRASCDSFLPAPIGGPAKSWQRRLEKTGRASAYFAEKRLTLGKHSAISFLGESAPPIAGAVLKLGGAQ